MNEEINYLPVPTRGGEQVVLYKVRPPKQPPKKISGPSPDAIRNESRIQRQLPKQVPVQVPQVRVPVRPRVNVPVEQEVNVQSRPRVSTPVEQEVANRFAPRFNYRVNYRVQRPVRLTREKFIEKKQEPVLLFFQEVPIRSLIQQRFAELVNKFFLAQDYTYAPTFKRSTEVGRYTASKDVNAKKMYTVNDYEFKKKDTYAPSGNIPVFPMPSFPNMATYNYSPESEVVIAPTAKLTLRTSEKKPIVKTTSQVVTYLQSLMSESETYG